MQVSIHKANFYKYTANSKLHLRRALKKADFHKTPPLRLLNVTS